MCWLKVSRDTPANGLCGVILFTLLACSPLFTTVQLCPAEFWFLLGISQCKNHNMNEGDDSRGKEKERRGLKALKQTDSLKQFVRGRALSFCWCDAGTCPSEM